MTSKLANPNSRHVKNALTRPCPLCDAQPGQLCVRTTQNIDGRIIDCRTKGMPLRNRIVHYARVQLRPNV